jgi:hypothetical protein
MLKERRRDNTMNKIVENQVSRGKEKQLQCKGGKEK